MMNPRPFSTTHVTQILFNHARLSSTVRPEREKFIKSNATDAVTMAATVEIMTIWLYTYFSFSVIFSFLACLCPHIRGGIYRLCKGQETHTRKKPKIDRMRYGYPAVPPPVCIFLELVCSFLQFTNLLMIFGQSSSESSFFPARAPGTRQLQLTFFLEGARVHKERPCPFYVT